jgi:AraC-like DNA-binding protein
MPLVDIALSVGFGSQSHFTSVFKRFVGQPPGTWRQSQGLTMSEAKIAIRSDPYRELASI